MHWICPIVAILMQNSIMEHCRLLKYQNLRVNLQKGFSLLSWGFASGPHWGSQQTSCPHCANPKYATVWQCMDVWMTPPHVEWPLSPLTLREAEESVCKHCKVSATSIMMIIIIIIIIIIIMTTTCIWCTCMHISKHYLKLLHHFDHLLVLNSLQ